MRKAFELLIYYLKGMVVSVSALLFCIMMSKAFGSEIIADIWVTKFALTRGIQHEKAKLEAGGKVAFTETDYYRNGEFELSENQAVAKAEVMRRKEIQSLQRRLDKLNELRFGDAK